MTFSGYYTDAKKAELQESFNLVADSSNWKMPVDAVIPEGKLEVCNEACLFYTGAGLTVLSRGSGTLRVTSPGYYRTIGA